MKKLLCVLVLLSFMQVCYADWNTFETKQDAYDRQSNRNYQTYQNNNHQMPLGGYNSNSLNSNYGTQYGRNYSSGFNMNNFNNSSRRSYSVMHF